MSITIKLYTFSKKENSTKRPASNAGTSFNCLIKTPSSLMFPYIELQNATNPVSYNYAYIADFNRYYFVNDWKFDRGLWYSSLAIDVLATYKTEIGSTSMYVLRASQQKNGYIKDMLFPITGKVTYDSTIFESGAGIGYQNGYFVITTVGSSNNAGQTVWQMNATQFETVMSALMASANGYQWGDLTNGVVNSLFNPTDYIVSAFWFPKAFSTLGGRHANFTCGLWDSNSDTEIIDNVQVPFTYTVNIPKHPQASSRGAYLNLPPFTTYELDLGFTRVIPLDPTKLVDVSQILVSVWADPMTGVAKVEGRTVTQNNQMQLFNIVTNYGVPVNIAMGKNNLFNAITDAVAVGAEAVSGGGLIGALGSAIGVADDFAKSVIGTVSNTGSVGSLSGHILPKRLFSRFFEVADNDNSHLGSPLCKVTTPATLGNGYIRAQDCDIDISAPASEIMAVKSKVEAGFFYE